MNNIQTNYHDKFKDKRSLILSISNSKTDEKIVIINLKMKKYSIK